MDTVNRIVPQLIASGHYQPPRLGIWVNNHSPRSQAILARTGEDGVVIEGVDPDGGAAQAGLRPTHHAANGSLVPGDIIQKIDSVDIRNSGDLFRVLEQRRRGDSVTVKVWRDGHTRQFRVQLN